MFWAFMYWLPSYLSSAYQLSLKQAGAFAIAPWAAGVVASVLGWRPGRPALRRNRRIRGRFSVMGVALLLSGCSLIRC